MGSVARSVAGRATLRSDSVPVDCEPAVSCPLWVDTRGVLPVLRLDAGARSPAERGGVRGRWRGNEAGRSLLARLGDVVRPGDFALGLFGSPPGAMKPLRPSRTTRSHLGVRSSSPTIAVPSGLQSPVAAVCSPSFTVASSSTCARVCAPCRRSTCRRTPAPATTGTPSLRCKNTIIDCVVMPWPLVWYQYQSAGHPRPRPAAAPHMSHATTSI